MMQDKLDFYGTMGPACCTEETFLSLFQEGMTGIRLNLSHSSLKESEGWLEAYFNAAARAGVPARLLADLQGPELRAGAFEGGLPLRQGETVLLGEGGIPVPRLVLEALEPGREILLDDGRVLLRATAAGARSARCEILRGGVLTQRKSIALPGLSLRPPTLTPLDHENIRAAAGCGVDGLMLPFVRDRSDLTALRDALNGAGAQRIQIHAKIENRMGMARLTELLPETDAVVIARGDLGNDMPLWELPAAQKTMARQCLAGGVPFMVVTQLLHSMQHSAVPTRAEVSDVFNAVLDGAASLMLTGETAVGEHPARAMRYLRRTAEEAMRFLREAGTRLGAAGLTGPRQ